MYNLDISRIEGFDYECCLIFKDVKTYLGKEDLEALRDAIDYYLIDCDKLIESKVTNEDNES